MNLILSLTKTRYLLYVEDDWWPAHDGPTPSSVGTENFLWRAMEVLRNSVERVSQVGLGVGGGGGVVLLLTASRTGRQNQSTRNVSRFVLRADGRLLGFSKRVTY